MKGMNSIRIYLQHTHTHTHIVGEQKAAYVHPQCTVAAAAAVKVVANNQSEGRKCKSRTTCLIIMYANVNGVMCKLMEIKDVVHYKKQPGIWCVPETKLNEFVKSEVLHLEERSPREARRRRRRSNDTEDEEGTMHS